MPILTPAQIAAYASDGVIVIRGAFTDWVDTMREGVERNMAEPSQYASENAATTGRFFDDYCSWARIPEFTRMVRESPAAQIAAEVMRSTTAQFFHEHVLVKEPGTPKPTPWHQDAPYYFVAGKQNVSFWMPLDPVKENTLQFIAGSHLWDRMIRPVSWADNSDFYEDEQNWTPVPDPDKSEILEWPMQPGDAVLFHFRTAHGARGNAAATRRRALSLRWVGDDARYTQRPGRTSPPFPDHDMREGQRLREDWFPLILP